MYQDLYKEEQSILGQITSKSTNKIEIKLWFIVIKNVYLVAIFVFM